MYFFSEVTSTLSNVVFERIPASSATPGGPPAVVSVAESEDMSSGAVEADREGGGRQDARKKWGGEGEAAPLIELLQHKQLQTATYAANVRDTG